MKGQLSKSGEGSLHGSVPDLNSANSLVFKVTVLYCSFACTSVSNGYQPMTAI